ncbi:MAG: hypothetical protein B7Z55_16685, partial [Planctomycetales bacterium 12-60-4]
ALYKTHFPLVARWPVEDLWPMVGVIELAWSFAPQKCLDFIDQHLLPCPEMDDLTRQCLHDLPEWDLESVQRIQTLALRASEERLWWAEDYVYLISDHNPDLAPLLASTLFSRRLDELNQNDQDADTERRTRNPLESTNEWHDLPAVAEAAPVVFLRELWSWFVKVATQWYGCAPSSLLNHYGHISHIYYPRSGPHMHRPVLKAFETAVQDCARLKPHRFVEITHAAWTIDNGPIQIMLARGLTEAARTIPAVGLKFLSSDARRLSLGCHSLGDDSYSFELIRAIGPWLDSQQLLEMETLIRHWSQYRPGIELCEDQLEWDRESRLRLLTAIPEDIRSSELSAFIASELSELPNALRKPTRMPWGFVSNISPISKDEMNTADD